MTFSCYNPNEQGNIFGSCSLGGLCFLTSQENDFLLLNTRHVHLPEASPWTVCHPTPRHENRDQVIQSDGHHQLQPHTRSRAPSLPLAAGF